MNQLESLLLQTKNTYDWSSKLLRSVPYKKWNTVPEVIESHICWQVGHLTLSIYFHTVMTLKGHDPEVLGRIPLREYSFYYASEEPPIQSVQIYSPEELLDNLIFMQSKSLETISGLKEEQLMEPLEPTKDPSPVANIKSESIAWNVQHCWWHFGQIGIIKRVIDKRYDFNVEINS